MEFTPRRAGCRLPELSQQSNLVGMEDEPWRGPYVSTMKKIGAVVIVLGVLGCGTVEEPSGPVSAGVGDEVGQFLDTYRLAIEARDAPRLRTMCVDDGRFVRIEDGEIRYRSPDEVLACRKGADAHSPTGRCKSRSLWWAIRDAGWPGSLERRDDLTGARTWCRWDGECGGIFHGRMPVGGDMGVVGRIFRSSTDRWPDSHRPSLQGRVGPSIQSTGCAAHASVF